MLLAAETGQAQPLLHVRSAAAEGKAAGASRAEHLIPFVPQIVPAFDPATGAGCAQRAPMHCLVQCGWVAPFHRVRQAPHGGGLPLLPAPPQAWCTCSRPAACWNSGASRRCWSRCGECRQGRVLPVMHVLRPLAAACCPPTFCRLLARARSLAPPPTHPLPSCATRLPRGSADLEPFTHPPPLSVLARMGLHIMPSAAQLEAAGRPDLVAAVRKAGGFLEVAQASGGGDGVRLPAAAAGACYG